MRKVLSGDGGLLLGEYNTTELCLSYHFLTPHLKLSVLLLEVRTAQHKILGRGF